MKIRNFLLLVLACAATSCGLKKGIEMSKILTQVDPAIGTGGQNARLAARLTGYKIDIKGESQVEG